MAKLDINDVQNLVNANPKLRKEMVKTAESELSYWEEIIEVLGGQSKPASRSASSDGKTHRQAIIDALGSFKSGAKASDLRKKMADSGHPIEPTTFASTMNYLVKQTKEVGKKKAEKGGRDNLYRLNK